MRIVVDGTLGAGKTTFLTGKSPGKSVAEYPNIADLGYPVHTELIRGTVDERLRKSNNPFEDWDDFFDIALRRAGEQYEAGDGDAYCFYDRGLPFLGVMATLYGVSLPSRYLDACRTMRYDDPIFIFPPITAIDYSKPRPGETRASLFTLEDRLAQHAQTVQAYEQLGYAIQIVPVLHPDKKECILRRLQFVRDVIGI